MGERKILFLTLIVHAASSNPTVNPSSSTINPASSTINPSGIASSSINLTVAISSNTLTTTTSSQYGFLSSKPPSSYEVTENVIDIPDDRTQSPIIPNFIIPKPLNLGNTSISINKVIKNETGDENNQPKRTSFTYVHFTKETEANKEGKIVKLFRGIKDYVYNLKKGVVDGLHNYFHRNDKKEFYSDKFHKSNDFYIDEEDSHHKYHRSFDNDDNFDDYEYNEDSFDYKHRNLND